MVTSSSPAETIELGLTPFLIGDGLKLVLAAVLFPTAWWVVGRRPDDR
jgi:biotin transport system substrate-specific component